MDEKIKTRLDNLFEEIDRLEKESDIFHISGSKSEFTKEVEELRGMHESITKDYQDYQASGKEDLERFRTSLMSHSDMAEQRVRSLRERYPKEKK